MIILKNTTDSLTITTTTTGNIDFSVSYADITTTTFAPSAFEGTMPAGATTTLLGGPAASTQRQVKLITIINRHSTTTNTVLVQKLMSGPLTYDLTPTVTLLAHESMQYVDGQGWIYYASNGAEKTGIPGAAGVDTSVQFNDGGIALGADADFIWDKTNNSLGIGTSTNNGSITLGGDTTDESAASANQALIYVKNVAGRMFPKWIGPSGVDTPFQAFLGFNGVRQVAPGTGTTAATAMQAFGTAFTNTGTLAQVAITSGSIKGRTRITTVASTGTAGNVGSNFTPNLEVMGEGGYFFSVRFCVAGTIRADQRMFFGLAGRTTIFANVNPMTDFTVAKVGIGCSLVASAGNWQICASTTAAAMSAVDLGATDFAVSLTDLIELVLYCTPGASSISYRVTNITHNVTTSGTLSSNIPATTVGLAVHNWVCNNTTAAIATLGLNKWYLESDF